MEDVVKVTVIATGFDAPATEQPIMQPAYHTNSAHYAAPNAQAHATRVAAQQAAARAPGRPSAPAPRTVLNRPSRPIDPAVRPSAAGPEAPVARVFGAAAIHDEAVLDIPAYLRRART
jgi:hypothetical protein